MVATTRLAPAAVVAGLTACMFGGGPSSLSTSGAEEGANSSAQAGSATTTSPLSGTGTGTGTATGSGGPASSNATLPSTSPPAPPTDPNLPTQAVTGPAPGIGAYGSVAFNAPASSAWVRLATTLSVPAQPAANGTLFLWPGLQPGGANYEPIDNGVLQPVLTWGGPSCAPGTQPPLFTTWWISGQYVNTYGHDPGFTGCLGGPLISVPVGDRLAIDMSLSGTAWTQTITSAMTGQSVSYLIDMQGQAQNSAEFIIESYSCPPVADVVFTDTRLTFAAPQAPTACFPTGRGPQDAVSTAKISANGLVCGIDRIVLRAEGVPATEPDAPGP